MTKKCFDSTQIYNLEQHNENKQNQGIDNCNTFFFH